MSEKLPVSVIIIARNEAANLRRLLPQLVWASEVIVAANDCQDETVAVAEENGARVETIETTDFAALRTRAMDWASQPWLFYVDADERVTPALQAEIAGLVTQAGSRVTAGRLRRLNFHYGAPMRYGGWQNDYVTRIFRRDSLQGWQGEIHESPVFEGEVKTLLSPLWHLTHRCTADNLRKSADWTIKEARLLAASPIAPVTAVTIARKMSMEFFRRYMRDGGWRDGMAGFVESLVQAMNRGLVYIQVWELQQQPTLAGKYELLEKEVQNQV
ncbi:glycosyltransferase family 2 protein [bacterium]|nr:glycosyltransferase family 2 protein [bacterium]